MRTDKEEREKKSGQRLKYLNEKRRREGCESRVE